jgi:DNA-binding response OmpR family regulator
MRVLVIEDNEAVGDSIRRMLEAQRYAANVVADGETGLDHLVNHSYDVAVVDVGLPKMNGFEVARSARQAGVHTPILMLTARDAVEDRVAGLHCGADDYLAKPFVEEELLARLGAMVRRSERPFVGIVTSGKLRIDLAARNVEYDGTPLTLGSTEFRVLEFFARNSGIALTRSQVVERIWDYDFDGSSNIVDVYVSQLRRKFAKLGAKNVIETVWGIGYRFSAS